MFKVIQTDRPAKDREEEDKIFNNCGLDIAFETKECMEEAELAKICADADALIAAYAPLTSRVIDCLTKCKGVSFMATGFNSIDLAYATQKGIIVTNVPDYCTTEVSDHALGFLLCLSRKIAFLHRSVCAGAWDYEACGQPDRISTQTLGIIGLGRIGTKVAQKAQAFGLRVQAYDPYVEKSYMDSIGVEKVSWPEVLGTDYLSLHCCLNDETRNIINAQALQRMKPSAYLINTARGACVDIEALTEALASGTIAGAALDVLNPEQLPAEHRLFTLKNVIITPHAAFLSKVSLQEVRSKCCQEVVAILKGTVPDYVVNPEVLKQDNCRIFTT